MKKLAYIACMSLLALYSCSSVQVVDSYVAPDFSNAKSNHFIVITRVANNDVRYAFEKSMADEFRSEGYNVTSSGTIYPNLDMAAQYTQSEINAFVDDLQSKGYDGVILNVLKDVRDETSTYPVGGGFYNYYPSYYYGFGGYYMNPIAYSSYRYPTYYDTQTYKVFTLETTVYNLNKPADKQLIGIVTNEITDPSNIIYDSDEYAQKVVKQLKKRR